MSESKVLFALTQDQTYHTTDVASKLEGLEEMGLGEYYDQGFLNEHIAELRENDAGNFSFDWHMHNPPGQWMSDNITTPNTVIKEPATLDNVAEHMEHVQPEYLVLSSFLGGYSQFKEISRFVRHEYPNTKIVAGSVGALLNETVQHADYRIKGDQVTDLRAILGEQIDAPLKPVTIRSDTNTYFNGMHKESSYGLTVGSLGCHYGCDFCPSTAQFGKSYSAPFTAESIKESIIASKEAFAPDADSFTISLAEPQGMGNVALWKEILASCRDLPFTCDLVTTTSSKIIQRYTPEELTEGNLRVTTVNIGVESLINGYRKNKNVDLKSVIQRLQGSGISIVSTFIVGFDWHTKENVRQEVDLLAELDSDGYIVANLEMQPGTPVFEAYRRSGRIKDVPPHLLNFYGYQAFEHPHFKPGFNDMLPLLSEVEDRLADGNQVFSSNLTTFLNRNNQAEATKRAELTAEIKEFTAKLSEDLSDADKQSQIDRFSAELYFKKAFRQMDLFHPFILSTN